MYSRSDIAHLCKFGQPGLFLYAERMLDRCNTESMFMRYTKHNARIAEKERHTWELSQVGILMNDQAR